ncbi:RNA polymerase subunit sigma-24 [Paenibacillus sp. FSL R10-2782]|uniref:RNA polymerase subunit sigma-24 n=1 Tax=Paenibacillus sp. FSL R10-2782 TaxID=2954661 RepID=UPI00315889CE
MSEQLTVNQLQEYKRLLARIKVLETYSITGGLLLSTLAGDDRLQELHKKLRGIKTYMYLNRHELELEQTAHAYLTRYPTGTRAQLAEVRQCVGADPDDDKLLRELEQKIQKVIKARGGEVDGYGFEDILDRISQLQDLESQKKYFLLTLDTLTGYNQKYGRILYLQYVEFKEPGDIADEMGISLPTLYKWRRLAIREYAGLIDGVLPIKL